MEHFDIAIIGTGSGNSILDERYTDKRVAICEQGTFGGTCLNVGCIPTKMFVYAAEVAENARDAAPGPHRHARGDGPPITILPHKPRYAPGLGGGLRHVRAARVVVA